MKQPDDSRESVAWEVPTRDEIAEKAYAIYVEEGRPSGHAGQNWVQAEAQLKRTGSEHPDKATSKPAPTSNSEKGPVPNPDAQPEGSWTFLFGLWRRKTTIIAALSIVGIAAHLALRFGFRAAPGIVAIPLLATLVIGGLPLLYDLLRKLLRREFGSDLLGGISIITSVLLGEYSRSKVPNRNSPWCALKPPKRKRSTWATASTTPRR